MHNEPEQTIIETPCRCNGQPGKVVVTSKRVLIKTRGFTGEQQQSIPRGTLTGVDTRMSVLMADITFHRQGGQPLTVNTVKKDAARQIEQLLNG